MTQINKWEKPFHVERGDVYMGPLMIILVTSGQRSCNTRTRFLQHPDKIPVTCGQHSCIIRTESA